MKKKNDDGTVRLFQGIIFCEKVVIVSKRTTLFLFFVVLLLILSHVLKGTEPSEDILFSTVATIMFVVAGMGVTSILVLVLCKCKQDTKT